jgi:hypothetical protein
MAWSATCATGAFCRDDAGVAAACAQFAAVTAKALHAAASNERRAGSENISNAS